MREKELSQCERERLLLSGVHLTVLGFISYVDSISKEVARFSPFMVSPMKNTVFIVSCVVLMFYFCSCYSLSKHPNIMLA